MIPWNCEKIVKKEKKREIEKKILLQEVTLIKSIGVIIKISVPHLLHT